MPIITQIFLFVNIAIQRLDVSFYLNNLYKVCQKNPQSNSLRNISAKTLIKAVKFGTLLAATFLNVSAENYTNMWFESNSIGISFTHTDLMR